MLLVPTLSLHHEAVLVLLVRGPAGLQHEGVHPGADLARGDRHVLGHARPEVQSADGVCNSRASQYYGRNRRISSSLLPITFSFSGYFQNAKVFPSKTTQRRCQAPNPETSSNMVRNPRLVTCMLFVLSRSKLRGQFIAQQIYVLPDSRCDSST